MTMNTNDDRQLLCFCFGYSAHDIRADIAANGRSLIMEKIMAAKRASGCNCATTNPKGR